MDAGVMGSSIPEAIVEEGVVERAESGLLMVAVREVVVCATGVDG
jgi:hypothetical protein